MLFTVCQYVGISKSKIYATTLFFVGFLVWLLVSVGNVWLLLSGVALGIVFYYFSFGFAGFWKHAILDRKTLGMRSHLVLLAVGGALFFPSLSLFPEFGYNIAGAVRPLGINVFIGAFIFGSGMALMGSCSSGTLKKMGSFDWLFYYVFLWMIIGGTLAASQMGFWLELPSLEPFSVATDIPWYLGLCLHLLVIFVLYRLLLKWEASRYEYIELLVFKGERGVVSSPLLLAATLVVILNYIILLVSHHPWAISWIFPKLGIIGIQELSLPIDWEFWEFSSQNESSLSKRVLDDSIVLTSLGMVIGVSLAFLGQTLVSRREHHHLSSANLTPACSNYEIVKRILFATFTGGMMGYGSVIAFGCNVGGFFSGIISGSLHGWLWLVSALLGMTLTLFIMNNFKRVRA